jgi:predicted RNase H-like HicB family nuclease
MKKASTKHKISSYTAVFEEDAKQGGYTVTIPALPGCISEGDTFEEAQANIKEAAQLYIEVRGKRARSAVWRDARVIVAPVSVAV